MSPGISESRCTTFKILAVVFAMLGTLWGGAMAFTLIQGFADHGEYHRREFEEALPMLILLTAVGLGFLIAAWLFWRASRRSIL